jgi:hypothetical protein
MSRTADNKAKALELGAEHFLVSSDKDAMKKSQAIPWKHPNGPS